MNKSQLINWIVPALVIVFMLYRVVLGQKRAATAREVIGQGALVIDVRTAGEFAQGHIPGALNIPYEEVDRLEKAVKKNPGKSVVLYCRSGSRSGMAARSLRQRGYEVINGGAYHGLKTSR